MKIRQQYNLVINNDVKIIVTYTFTSLLNLNVVLCFDFFFIVVQISVNLSVLKTNKPNCYN